MDELFIRAGSLEVSVRQDGSALILLRGGAGSGRIELTPEERRDLARLMQIIGPS